ncbi:MAG: hypothetical protein V2A72_05170 [Candidatus Omnitrophota bacterium]
MKQDNYRETMNGFYSKIADFISGHPEIIEELTEQEAYLKDLCMEDEKRRMLVLDYYIFDYKSPILPKNLLLYFLSKADLDNETRAVYERFTNSVFSIFEIRALRTGKEVTIVDLITTKEYSVRDTTLTKNTAKGQCGFMRLLPFKNYYIFTGAAYLFPHRTSHFLKLHLLDIKSQKRVFKLTPLEICKIFYSQEKPERLPVRERFKLLCREGGLEEAYIIEVMQRSKDRAQNKGEFNDILKEVFSKMKPSPDFNPDEITAAFMGMWNEYIAAPKDYIAPGPTEHALIGALMSLVQSKIKPNRYKNMQNATDKANGLMDEWLKTPRQELNGKTPKEIIIKEREELGNTIKTIKYRTDIATLSVGEEVIKKAEDIYNKAHKLLMDNKPSEAIECYKEYLAINSENHVVWQNMGLAYMLLCDRVNAEKCFREALNIKPDYRVAKNNMAILLKASDKDIEIMAKEFKIMIVNKGKSSVLPDYQTKNKMRPS